MKSPTAFTAGIRALEYLFPEIIDKLGFSIKSQTTTYSSSNKDATLSNSKGRRLHQATGIETYASISNKLDGIEAGLKPGQLLAFTATISASGSYRMSSGFVRATKVYDDDDIDLQAAAQGLLVREEEPESVSKEDIGPTAADTPNPEERGAASRGGLNALVIAEMTLKGLNGKKYRTIAKGVVIPNGASESVRGVIQIDADVGCLSSTRSKG
eukprot:TRINITY_DN3944_c0_g3_i3.p2 TRINITY_DN3944_c0_g3~~TRINITY_DN3944_c0_g3_i3.p2  ORF type:complete len:213 (+),score=45.07 TRINITY_DN3944_c0_g3_i3:450-1088(+)